MRHKGLRRIARLYQFLAVTVLIFGEIGAFIVGMQQPGFDIGTAGVFMVSAALAALGLYAFALALLVLIDLADSSRRTAEALERMRRKQ